MGPTTDAIFLPFGLVMAARLHIWGNHPGEIELHTIIKDILARIKMLNDVRNAIVHNGTVEPDEVNIAITNAARRRPGGGVQEVGISHEKLKDTASDAMNAAHQLVILTAVLQMPNDELRKDTQRLLHKQRAEYPWIYEP